MPIPPGRVIQLNSGPSLGHNRKVSITREMEGKKNPPGKPNPVYFSVRILESWWLVGLVGLIACDTILSSKSDFRSDGFFCSTRTKPLQNSRDLESFLRGGYGAIHH